MRDQTGFNYFVYIPCKRQSGDIGFEPPDDGASLRAALPFLRGSSGSRREGAWLQRRGRASHIAWLVPLSGASAMKTFVIPAAGLTIGNNPRYDLIVSLSGTENGHFRISQQEDQGSFVIRCPAGHTILLNGVPKDSGCQIPDNAELQIGDMKMIFKLCDLSR